MRAFGSVLGAERLNIRPGLGEARRRQFFVPRASHCRCRERGRYFLHMIELSTWQPLRLASALTASLAFAGCGGTDTTAEDGPTVVSTIPSDGERDVDSELGVLSVTFSESMGDGWSWVTEAGHSAPEVKGFAFYVDETTNVLPVRLAPHTSYAIWVNSPDHAELRKFASADGVSARAYRIQFATR